MSKLVDKSLRTPLGSDIVGIQPLDGSTWYKTTIDSIKSYITALSNTWTAPQTIEEAFIGDLEITSSLSTVLADSSEQAPQRSQIGKQLGLDYIGVTDADFAGETILETSTVILAALEINQEVEQYIISYPHLQAALGIGSLVVTFNRVSDVDLQIRGKSVNGGLVTEYRNLRNTGLAVTNDSGWLTDWNSGNDAILGKTTLPNIWTPVQTFSNELSIHNGVTTYSKAFANVTIQQKIIDSYNGTFNITWDDGARTGYIKLAVNNDNTWMEEISRYSARTIGFTNGGAEEIIIYIDGGAVSMYNLTGDISNIRVNGILTDQ